MTCDRLVCANCAGPVSEARCAVCRAERDRRHRQGPLISLTPATLLALLLTLLAVALLAHQAAGT
ncbi:hypothetical protein [Streptomyces alkaliterrae]|uniref:Uncharacterized protein n=1 Tax=Streptomyces alkaliterrae TaxID=2213162 RepID=A0A5P0YMJ5_9ACTN|nr:hypothetical protein [Streptomyces alkaliterrae]MBB1254294.1 hypothetical protein [Streptomyces alkaliterrae]MBB1262237.1 hypothetical protein [Streptomyces alkaliterrae]MQS00632.1 hypothetical protein [Streptomyces alkaliterrae]